MSSLHEAPFCSESPSFLSSVMARTRGGHSRSFRPRVRPSSPPQNLRAPAMSPPAAPPAAVEPLTKGPVIAPSAAPPATTPETHRYYTRTGALPPSSKASPQSSAVEEGMDLRPPGDFSITAAGSICNLSCSGPIC